MLSWLLAFIPAPWIIVLKKIPWRLIGYIALAAFIAFWVWRVIVWHDAFKHAKTVEAALKAEQDCNPDTHCSQRLLGLQEQGTAAVEAARQSAQEAAEAAQAKRDEEARAESDRLKAAAQAAAGREDAWRRKYLAASTKTGRACERWSQEKVPCPVE